MKGHSLLCCGSLLKLIMVGYVESKIGKGRPRTECIPQILKDIKIKIFEN